MNTRKAREIMGEDFIGPEEIIGNFGLIMNYSSCPALINGIPFDEKELKGAKGSFILMLVPPISINKMRERWSNLFQSEESIAPIDRIKGSFLEDAGEKPTWYLIRKGILDNSYGKDWAQQRILVYQKRAEEQIGKVILPSARIVIFADIAYNLTHNGRHLISPGCSVRTSSRDEIYWCVSVEISLGWGLIGLSRDDERDGAKRLGVSFVLKKS